MGEKTVELQADVDGRNRPAYRNKTSLRKGKRAAALGAVDAV